MKDRLFWLRKSELKLSREKFGERVGMSGSEIRNIEDGVTRLKENKIPLICREFGVNRAWLETGEGEPFIPLGKKEELKAIFSDVLSGRVSDKNAFVEAIAQLPDDVFPVLVKSWIAAAEQMKEKLKDQQE